MPMHRRKQIIHQIIGSCVAGLVLVFVFWAPTVARPGGAHGHQSDLVASFGDTTGLQAGAPVMLAGTQIGKVQSLALERNFAVQVRIRLDQAIAIPLDSSASVVSSTLLGTKFIDIKPGGAFETLHYGDSFDYTEDSLDFVEVLYRIVTAAENRRKINAMIDETSDSTQ
ncbi:MAG: MlaD family protein [Pseudomonadota bacterium]